MKRIFYLVVIAIVAAWSLSKLSVPVIKYLKQPRTIDEAIETISSSTEGQTGFQNGFILGTSKKFEEFFNVKLSPEEMDILRSGTKNIFMQINPDGAWANMIKKVCAEKGMSEKKLLAIMNSTNPTEADRQQMSQVAAESTRRLVLENEKVSKVMSQYMVNFSAYYIKRHPEYKGLELKEYYPKTRSGCIKHLAASFRTMAIVQAAAEISREMKEKDPAAVRKVVIAAYKKAIEPQEIEEMFGKIISGLQVSDKQLIKIACGQADFEAGQTAQIIPMVTKTMTEIFSRTTNQKIISDAMAQVKKLPEK